MRLPGVLEADGLLDRGRNLHGRQRRATDDVRRGTLRAPDVRAGSRVGGAHGEAGEAERAVFIRLHAHAVVIELHHRVTDVGVVGDLGHLLAHGHGCDFGVGVLPVQAAQQRTAHDEHDAQNAHEALRQSIHFCLFSPVNPSVLLPGTLMGLFIKDPQLYSKTLILSSVEN